MARKSPSERTPYARPLARLPRRDHSEQEIRLALGRDGFAEDAVEETVSRLRRVLPESTPARVPSRTRVRGIHSDGVRAPPSHAAATR